jgi:hypothetical protein
VYLASHVHAVRTLSIFELPRTESGAAAESS